MLKPHHFLIILVYLTIIFDFDIIYLSYFYMSEKYSVPLHTSSQFHALSSCW